MSETLELSDESASRAQLAINEFKSGEFGFLITSGWAYRQDCDVPISHVMRNFILNSCNFDPQSLISLPYARDTVGDAYYCLEYLQLQSPEELVVITSDYHVGRTKVIFEKIFDSRTKIKVRGAKTEVENDKKRLLHEAASLQNFFNTFSDTNCLDIGSIHSTLATKHPFYNGVVYPKI